MAMRSDGCSASRIAACCSSSEIFKQVDDIVGLEAAHRLLQDIGLQRLDHLLAHALAEFGQDLAVELLAVELDEGETLRTVELLQNVRDIRRMQRLHQLGEARGVLLGHRLADLRRLARVEAVDLLVLGLRLFDVGVCHHSPLQVAGTIGRRGTGAQGRGEIYPDWPAP